jgi:hypothetical protein
VFDSIVVITDRRVLDRQLQSTMRQFEQTLGVVENIDTTSRSCARRGRSARPHAPARRVAQALQERFKPGPEFVLPSHCRAHGSPPTEIAQWEKSSGLTLFLKPVLAAQRELRIRLQKSRR